MAYFKQKAQTLTELAVFGSILLLALSFLINYGMRYNYQQDLQMRAFRKALSQAYWPTDLAGNKVPDRPDASASVALLEDKHIPDPRDMFGAGSVTPVTGQAEVTWGNTLGEGYSVTNDAALPRVKYLFNDNSGTNKQEREYTTAGYSFIATGSKFYAILPGNTEPQLINWEDVKCYQPTSDSPQQAMVALPNHEIEVITDVYQKPVGAKDSEPRYIKYQIIGVRATNPSGVSPNGYPLDRIDLLSPDSGELNSNYMQLNNDVDRDGLPDVTPANLQGLLPDAKQTIKRSGTLTIKETPGTTKSTSVYSFQDNNNNPTIITHKIRSSSGVEEINSPFERAKSSTWETPK